MENQIRKKSRTGILVVGRGNGHTMEGLGVDGGHRLDGPSRLDLLLFNGRRRDRPSSPGRRHRPLPRRLKSQRRTTEHVDCSALLPCLSSVGILRQRCISVVVY